MTGALERLPPRFSGSYAVDTRSTKRIAVWPEAVVTNGVEVVTSGPVGSFKVIVKFCQDAVAAETGKWVVVSVT